LLSDTLLDRTPAGLGLARLDESALATDVA